MNLTISLLVFYFGASIGSFLNVVILRLPNEEELGGRSHCLKCKRQLSLLDLFPIFSFILLRGKCRTCKNPISIRYPIIEVIAGLLFLFRWLNIEPTTLTGTLSLLRDWIFLSSLIVIFTIDLEHYLILDKILLGFGLPILAINIFLDIISKNFFNFRNSLVLTGLMSGLSFALIFFALWFFSQGKWIGFGDVKLMIFLGLALGWPATFIGWLGAFFIGTVFSIPLLIFKKKELSSKLPLGCFLSVSSVLALFWGNAWFHWYLAILGL